MLTKCLLWMWDWNDEWKTNTEQILCILKIISLEIINFISNLAWISEIAIENNAKE